MQCLIIIVYHLLVRVNMSICQDLKNWKYARGCVRNAYAKAFERARKNVHAKALKGILPKYYIPTLKKLLL